MNAGASQRREASPAPRAPHALARLATRALWDELALHPKPGLVSFEDPGAHGDMDARTFMRSLFALRPHFAALAAAGAQNAAFADLRAIGIDAEAAMLAATRGVNTHRGAIFALGLLVAAVARIEAAEGRADDTAIRATLRATWGAALAAHAAAPGTVSHGALVGARHGAGGARAQAAAAFPAVFDIALPALRTARARGADAQHARLAALFALIACVDDTNVLYRGGLAGLAFVQTCGRAFGAAVDPLAYAAATHRAFVARRLSPGGVADLLAATLFVDAVGRTSR